MNAMRSRSRIVVEIALVLTGIDLGLIVLSGGLSAFGPLDSGGFTFRLVSALFLLGLHYFLARRPEKASFYGYLGLLLLLIPLLHFRGYRLRGDGLWYYSYAHSVSFDRDIDLTNQYQRLGIDHFRGSQPVRESGLARYTFPVGAPLMWVPFVQVGHLGVWLRNVHGIETAYDGYSDPYFHSVALSSLLIGWVGLLVLDRFLRRWFSPAMSFATVAATGFASFLMWYLAYQPIYTHTLTFLLICSLLLRWVHHREAASDFAILGLLLGAAACVRWQNAVFGILPALSLARGLMDKRWRFSLTGAGALAGTFLLGILPQLVTWKIIFDRFWIGVPLGAGYMRWADPFLTETLFSSRHGLFSWSPVLIFAAFGLFGFLWRHPRFGLPLMCLLILQTYINSAVADWWAGGSFGARRFDSVLPILALGLATAVAWLSKFVRRRPEAVVAGLLILFISANGLFMEQYRKGRIPTDDTISWETAAQGILEDVFDAVGYPFSFPANWIFAAKYDRPKTQYDLLVGKYLFHRMNNLGGVIELGENDPPFIGNGWSGVTDWEDRPRTLRLAVGPRAGIFVPTDRAEPLRIFIECAAPKQTEPQWVEVWLNGQRLGGFLPGKEMKEHVVTTDERWWRRINLLELAASKETHGNPYLAVDRLRFERLQQ
jgi:hypothetical protein